ncbi:MAG TPA: hypothetical protein VNQ77_15130 [Frankiaceae bacterium]|nr:hypothetical protein [Frankiaceae bacterium]
MAQIAADAPVGPNTSLYASDALLSRQKPSERLPHIAADDSYALGFEVELQVPEHGVGQEAPTSWAERAVERLRIIEIAQGEREQLSADAQVAAGLGEVGGDLLAFRAQGDDFGLQLDLRPVRVADEGKVGVLLLLDLREASFERVLDHVHGGELVVQGSGEPLAHEGDELRCQPHRGVVLLDGSLDVLDQQIRQVALLQLPAAAEEVEVNPSIAFGTQNQQAVAAAVTPEVALQVVVVAALPNTGTAVGVEDRLDPIEAFVADDPVVAGFDPLAVYFDAARVVAVPQDAAERFQGDRTFGVSPVGAGREAGFGHARQQALQREAAGFHPLEGFVDERRALFVQGDGAHGAAVNVDLDVAVAELGPAWRAAVLDLLMHLVLDVGGACLHLVLVYGVNDCLDHLRFQRVAEVEVGGDNPNAELPQFVLGDRGFQRVAEDSGELVDDHEVDVAALPDTGDHLEVDGALLDLGGRPPRLDVDGILGDGDAHGVGLLQGCDALGGDRDAFGVEVVVDLARRGHAQVEGGALHALCRRHFASRRHPWAPPYAASVSSSSSTRSGVSCAERKYTRGSAALTSGIRPRRFKRLSMASSDTLNRFAMVGRSWQRNHVRLTSIVGIRTWAANSLAIHSIISLRSLASPPTPSLACSTSASSQSIQCFISCSAEKRRRVGISCWLRKMRS